MPHLSHLKALCDRLLVALENHTFRIVCPNREAAVLKRQVIDGTVQRLFLADPISYKGLQYSENGNILQWIKDQFLLAIDLLQFETVTRRGITFQSYSSSANWQEKQGLVNGNFKCTFFPAMSLYFKIQPPN
jgi:hypothetical protein